MPVATSRLQVPRSRLTAKLSAASAPAQTGIAQSRQQQQQKQQAKPVNKRLAALAISGKPKTVANGPPNQQQQQPLRLMHGDGAAGLLGSGFNLTWVILAVMLVAVIGVVISSHQHVSGLGYKLDVLMATLA